jgi:tetratricopeptide (TPR) repeat protein
MRLSNRYDVYSIIILLLTSCSTNRVAQLKLSREEKSRLESPQWQPKNSQDTYVFMGEFPTSIEACLNGDFSKGATLLKAELGNGKAKPAYWNAIGTCYFLTSDFAKAKFYYQLGLELDSKYTQIIHNLALVDIQEKKWNAALDKLHSIENDSSTLPKYSLALVYFSVGDIEQAKKYFQDIVELSPKHLFARLGLMKCLALENSYTQVLQNYNELSLEDRSLVFRNLAAYSYYELKQYTQSLTLLQIKEATRSPAHESYQRELKNKVEQAMKDLKERKK